MPCVKRGETGPDPWVARATTRADNIAAIPAGAR